MSGDTKSCKTCVFSASREEPFEGAIFECRKRPPSHRGWPEVNPDTGWCGEFTPSEGPVGDAQAIGFDIIVPAIAKSADDNEAPWPRNRWRRWTEDEDKAIIKCFNDMRERGFMVERIAETAAKLVQRTPGATHYRLIRLGCITRARYANKEGDNERL